MLSAPLVRTLAVAAAALVLSCRGCAQDPPIDAGPPDASDAAADIGPDAATTEAPDGAVPASEIIDAAAPDAEPELEGRKCPPDMVRVARRYCVDRYEAMVEDAASGQLVSPYYPPSRKMAVFIEKLWSKQLAGNGPGVEDGDDAGDRQLGPQRLMPLPVLPGWQKAREFSPRAVSKRGVTPQGYTSGEMAELACKNAGKRLCSMDEWRTACRGESDRPFPYGEEYEQGACNIFREGHPAVELHGKASINHTDPRLNQVKIGQKPLLRRTGDTKRCLSEWEGDAIADMNGNIDEWIDDPEGTFLGGFFSRSKKDGCESTIKGHDFNYFDYSTGIRCCKDLP